jgi:hypothetical protein
MSPETGPSTVPQFDRGGRFVENSILSLPDGHKAQVRGPLRESNMKPISTLLFSAFALLTGGVAFAAAGANDAFEQIVVTGARTPLALNQLG